MGSFLGWVDYDPSERERTTRMLALFAERNTRDELGLGTIRDSIADRLFPGTNTIQTRLRYMLFVPWVYLSLEREATVRANLAREARKRELALITPLLANDDSAGVFGGRSGDSIQRLPSGVYWSGLGAWGIRRFEGSQEAYHQEFERLRERRRRAARRDDYDLYDEPTPTWDPELPNPPPGFPEQVSLRLTSAEAEYLRDRIRFTHGGSFLAYLVGLGAAPVEVAAPWFHPAVAEASEEHRRLLRHARYFSEVMHGAALLYNLMLAQKKGIEERVEEHTQSLRKWSDSMRELRPSAWDLAEFFRLVHDPHHRVEQRAPSFVRAWASVARTEDFSVATGSDAQRLVQMREMDVRPDQSRFRNPGALQRWRGASGVAPFRFRWPTVQGYLRELHQAGDES